MPAGCLLLVNALLPLTIWVFTSFNKETIEVAENPAKAGLFVGDISYLITGITSGS